MSGTVRGIGGQTAVLLVTTSVLSALDCTYAREREGGRLSERKKLEIHREIQRGTRDTDPGRQREQARIVRGHKRARSGFDVGRC